MVRGPDQRDTADHDLAPAVFHARGAARHHDVGAELVHPGGFAAEERVVVVLAERLIGRDEHRVVVGEGTADAQAQFGDVYRGAVEVVRHPDEPAVLAELDGEPPGHPVALVFALEATAVEVEGLGLVGGDGQAQGAVAALEVQSVLTHPARDGGDDVGHHLARPVPLGEHPAHGIHDREPPVVLQAEIVERCLLHVHGSQRLDRVDVNALDTWTVVHHGALLGLAYLSKKMACCQYQQA